MSFLTSFLADMFSFLWRIRAKSPLFLSGVCVKPTHLAMSYFIISLQLFFLQIVVLCDQEFTHRLV